MANAYAEVPVRRAIVADAAFPTVPIVAGQNWYFMLRLTPQN